MQNRVIMLGLGLALCLGRTFAEEVDEEYFERHIRPVLVEKCYGCHSTAAGKSEGGLLLDRRQALLEGGESGPAIAPGDPHSSLLMEAIRYESLEMPPDKPLSPEQIDHFERWIQHGAVDPRDAADIAQPGSNVDWHSAAEHWAFRPIQAPRLPVVTRQDWCLSAIDRFVLDQLEEQGMQPAQDATRWQWLRRVTFDLTGLPPTLEEQDRFLSDRSPDAYARVVDRLLASPRYGERWGRHWLDLARYADTNGADENHAMPVAWRYRDYVVSAFNDDKPYDRFVQEQLAGDLLPSDSEAQRRDALTATGFLALGPKMLAEQDKPKLVADLVDEQIDTVGKVFMGLTLGCARCHDHKFDPISAEDYYSLAGIFHSTQTMEHLDHVSQWLERPLPDTDREQQITQHQTNLAAAQSALAQLKSELRRRELEWTLNQLRIALNQLGQLAADPVTAEPAEADARVVEFVTNSPSMSLWISLLNESKERPVSDQLTELWKQLSDTPSQPAEALQAEITAELLALQPQPPTDREAFIRLALTLVERRWQALDIEKFKPGANGAATLDQALFSEQGLLPMLQSPQHGLSEDQLAQLANAEKRVAALTETMPEPYKVMAVDDASVKLVALHVRGNHLQMQGDPLPRNVPSVLHRESLPTPEFPENSSGRLEFARWLTAPNHPLTARVMANRVWQGLFGKGLVTSPSNFGLRGDLPTHPQLLDWLALKLQSGDWSIKQLQRQIVLSRAYRQSSATDRFAEVDPENSFLWRQNRRRLEAESVRDTLLAVAADLDAQLGGLAEPPQGQYEDLHIPKTELDSQRRTIYLKINRAALDDFYSTFDYVDPAASLSQRPATIVPHQALFLMNHPLAMHAGGRLAERVVNATEDDTGRIEMAYRLVLQRPPTPTEMESFREFLNEQDSPVPIEAWERACRALLLSNEFLYVD